MSTRVAPPPIRVSRFVTAGGVVAVMAGIEVLTGIQTHSLALVSDATHLATDVATLALTSWAVRRAARPANAGNTFGYLRSGIMTATVNALILTGIAISIAAAAAGRLAHPQPVNGGPILAVGMLALAVNLSLAFALHGSHELSQKSAVWHFAGDALASASVIVGAIVILTTGWRTADPIVSFVISGLIALGGLALLRETTEILHESTPRDIDADEVRKLIVGMDGIEGIHDLHIWSLDRRHRAMSAHVTVRDESLTAVTGRLREIEVALCDRFGIEHATIQPECPTCVDEPDLFCVIDERHEAHLAAGMRSQEA